MAGQQHRRCDETGAWSQLRAHFEVKGRAFDVRRALAEDPTRVQAFGIEAPHVFADLSKNLLDDEAQQLLLQLACPVCMQSSDQRRRKRECSLALFRFRPDNHKFPVEPLKVASNSERSCV